MKRAQSTIVALAAFATASGCASKTETRAPRSTETERKPQVSAFTAQTARNLALTASLRERMKGAPSLTQGQRRIMMQASGTAEPQETNRDMHEMMGRRAMMRRQSKGNETK